MQEMGHEDSTLSKSLNLLELGVRGKTRGRKWEKDGRMRGGVEAWLTRVTGSHPTMG